jgi:CheY-like chemotaxis protein
VLRVRDNGIGVAPEFLPYIFDLFAQADRGPDRKRGIGIGLTVVRRLVELHGGRVEARSQGLDQGTEFTVRLPALAGGEAELAAAAEPTEAVPTRRILLVEDNADAAEAQQMLLELLGHRVRVARNATVALDAVRAEVPEVALIDIGLPDIDGYELVKRLREQPGMERTTFVAMTGYGRVEDKQHAIAAGFHFHLTKPVDQHRLQALMADLMADATD